MEDPGFGPTFEGGRFGEPLVRSSPACQARVAWLVARREMVCGTLDCGFPDIAPVYPMPWRIAVLVLLCAALGGCSYGYRLLAAVRGGQLVFVIDPNSDHAPSCLRQVEIIAEHGPTAQPRPGDDTSRVGYGTFWFESIGYDDACANSFPLPYGARLAGQHQPALGTVAPKPLLRNVVYNVSTTTGATGYGNGRFVIRSNGQVENLRSPN